MQLEGWLEKKTIFGLWLKRYFILLLGKLSIYKEPSIPIPESSFELDSQTTVETISNDNKLKVIIQKPKVVTLILRASSTNEMIDWVFHLRRAAFTNKTLYITLFRERFLNLYLIQAKF